MKVVAGERLAIDGGERVKRTPFGTGRRLGDAEKQQVAEALESDVLFYVSGTKVKEMEAKMRAMYGMKHCNGCSSGTAAVHIALGTLGLEPGREIITSSVTDMGTLTGVLYQLLIPRFADIDPLTYNMDPSSVESLINERTGAILVVHHAGLAADMDRLMDIARRHNLPVIEDCAQAHYTTYKGRLCGTFGDISCFSLNHFKHISTGSGGMVLTNRDDLEEVAKLFVDKCYFRDGRKRNPYFLAPNYQMTELQGAVAIAQLDKVRAIVSRRHELGTRLASGLRKIEGIIPQVTPADSPHNFFLYIVRVDRSAISVGVEEFCKALAAEGVPTEPQKLTGFMPVYRYDVFKNRSAFPGTQFPFVSEDLGTDVDYPEGLCPVAERAFGETFNFNINEFFTEQDIDEMIEATAKVAGHYRR
jgi:perosamine synthetase